MACLAPRRHSLTRQAAAGSTRRGAGATRQAAVHKRAARPASYRSEARSAEGRRSSLRGGATRRAVAGLARRGAAQLGMWRRSLQRGGAFWGAVATCEGGGARRAAAVMRGIVAPASTRRISRRPREASPSNSFLVMGSSQNL